MQFSKSAYPDVRFYSARTVVFPLSFASWHTLIGVGFWIDGVVGYEPTKYDLSGFTTTSNGRAASNFTWLALGI